MVRVLVFSNTYVHRNAQFSGSVSLTPKILKFCSWESKQISFRSYRVEGRTNPHRPGGESYKFNSLTQLYAICSSLVKTIFLFSQVLSQFCNASDSAIRAGIKNMKRKLAKYNIQLKVHYKIGLNWVCHDGLENSHLGLVLMKNGLGSCLTPKW